MGKFLNTETGCLRGEECEYVRGHEDEMDRKRIHKDKESELTQFYFVEK